MPPSRRGWLAAAAIGTVALALLAPVADAGTPPDTDPPTWSGTITPATPQYTLSVPSMQYTWGAASDAGGLAALPYVYAVLRAPAQSGGGCGAFTISASGSTGATSFSLPSAIPNNCYKLQVAARDSSGNMTAPITSSSITFEFTAPTATFALSESVATMTAAGDTLYIGTPAAGQSFVVTYTINDVSPSSLTGCDPLAGFNAVASGSAPWTCTYTATGSGYADADVHGAVRDVLGIAGVSDLLMVRRVTTPPSGTVQVTESAPTMTVASGSLYVGTPASGATFTATYTPDAGPTGLASIICAAVSGFTASRSGATDCVYTATGSGYGAGTFTATLVDNVGNRGDATGFTLVRDTAAPTATVALTENVPTMAVTGTTLHVGSPASGATVSATFTVSDPPLGFGSASCSSVAGFTMAEGTGNPFTCTYTATGSGYASGVGTATLVDKVGNSGTASFTVTRDTTGPVLAFTGQADPTIITGAASIGLQWSEDDGNGAGVAGRSLQRQRASITQGGQCPSAGGAWVDEGAPITGASPASVPSLPDQRCYRWIASLVDRAGNSTSTTSSAFLVDRTGPTMVVTFDSASPSMHGRGDQAFIGSPAAHETLTASFELGDVIAAHVSCPVLDGFTLASFTDTTCVYETKASGITGGDYLVEATDLLGNLTRVSFSVVLDPDGPIVAFVTPADALSLVTGTTVDLEWYEGDVGSGVASHRLQRQAGAVVTPGTCAGVTWADDGSPVDAGPVTAAAVPADGPCYRWIATVKDHVGNVGRGTSNPVLSDRSGPGLTITLESNAQHIAVARRTVTVSDPLQGEQFAATIGVTDAASGFASLTCPEIPGFVKEKSGSAPTFVCTWTARGGDHAPASPQVRATDQAGNQGSIDFTVALGSGATLDPMPAGWASKDIGDVGVPGSSGVLSTSGLFQATGAGLGFSGTRPDSFRLTSRGMSGDGSFAARLTSQAAPSAKGLAGVMVRQGAALGAPPFVFVGRRADGAIVVIRRTVTGAVPVTTKVAGATAGLPVEVRIKRTGNVFLAQYRLPGGSWTKAASVTVPMSAATRAGIAVTSRSFVAASVVTWDRVAFVP